MSENKYVLVAMSQQTAVWLGNAASVAGGCVAVSDAGRDAAKAIGRATPLN